MSLTISVNQPNLPEGEPVYIQGLGLFENGSPPRQLTDEEIQNWQVFHPGRDLTKERFYGVEISNVEQKNADEVVLHDLEKSEEKAAPKKTAPKTEKEVN
jgi:hypothetical protein